MGYAYGQLFDGEIAENLESMWGWFCDALDNYVFAKLVPPEF